MKPAVDVADVQEIILTTITHVMGFERSMMATIDPDRNVLIGWLTHYRREDAQSRSGYSHTTEIPLRAEAGAPTAKELALAEQLDKQAVTDEWLYQKGGLRQPGVKIHEDVRVLEAAHKAQGGLIRVTARVRQGRIADIPLSGDFTMLPKFAPGALELALRGTALEASAIKARITDVYRSVGIQSPGVTPDDLTNAVMGLGQS